MRGTALGHQLETLNDGLTTFMNGERVPMPLIATNIQVEILAGAATVKTTRRFRNAEQTPIEAIMTFPVGFDAVVTGLVATIDGRRMVGIAKEKTDARETYETAIDEGRMSVLHEEALRGIHILSVGALPPGAEVTVELEQVVPLTEVSGKQFLRLPMTAGQLYGNSPLLPVDDFVTSEAVKHKAGLRVLAEAQQIYLNESPLHLGEEINILLNRALELVIEDGSFGLLQGRSADGRTVSLSFKPTHGHQAALDLDILVDRSGSTEDHVGTGVATIWQAMRDGLSDVLHGMRPSDRISLWQFDNACQFLGTARGGACANLVSKLQAPQGGTELAGALRSAIAAGAQDLLVLTDGQTWAHIINDLKSEAVRISAILVGAGSLDANIGHLCAMTGGQLFYAPGADVTSSLRSAFEALRTPSAAVVGQANDTGPDKVTVLRGGITIGANWAAKQKAEETPPADAIGRFAAALAIPLMETTTGAAWACMHNLCTHSTSLVLVGDVGQVAKGFSQMRKVAMMAPRSGVVSLDESSEAIMRLSCRKQSTYFEYFDPPRNKASIASDCQSSSARGLISRMSLEEQKKDVSPTMNNREGSGMIARLIARIRAREHGPVEIVFGEFEWDRHGDALLSGDLSSLTHDQHKIVKQSVEVLKKLSIEHALKIEEDTLTVHALGLIARKMGNRLAARFARRALNDAPSWILLHRT